MNITAAVPQLFPGTGLTNETPAKSCVYPNDCNPRILNAGIPAILANPGTLKLQKVVKTTFFSLVDKKNNNSSRLMKYYTPARVLALHCKLHLDSNSHFLQFRYTYR